MTNKLDRPGQHHIQPAARVASRIDQLAGFKVAVVKGVVDFAKVSARETGSRAEIVLSPLA